jgi:hypothetical protein
MVRLRRTAVARNRTPYSRPVPPQPQPQPQSPNWLSRFVISPTRFIASGAGKILSTVLDLESSPSSSSSSATSSSSSYADSVAGNSHNSIFCAISLLWHFCTCNCNTRVYFSLFYELLVINSEIIFTILYFDYLYLSVPKILYFYINCSFCRSISWGILVLPLWIFWSA